jgi:hypothetical protein
MVKRIVIHHEEIQIVFKTDPDLKDAALEKAKQEGMTLKAVLCSAMRAYVNDEMVMKMTRREEEYETDDGSPKAKAPPEKKEKIKSGIKSPVRNIESIKKKNSRKISNS